MIHIQDYRDELIKRIVVPDDFAIEPDWLTDNILVTGKEFGFSLSRATLEDWSIDRVAQEVAKGIDAIQRGDDSVELFKDGNWHPLTEIAS